MTARRTTPSGPRWRRAATAAFQPQAPWTPPPGCAEAPARYRPGTGVSGRPRPRVGRRTSCWCSAAVPALRAPGSGWRRRPARSRGRLHLARRAGLDRNPGATALDGLLHALDLARRSPPRRPAQPARQVRVRPGRLGALGGAGGVGGRHLAEQHEGVTRHPTDRQVGGDVDETVVVDPEVHRARPPALGCRPRDGGVEGPVDLEGRVVPVEAAQVVQQPGWQVAARRRGRRTSAGAGTSASTACRARTRLPSASRTPRARPADTSTSVTGTPQRTCTPSDSARRRRAVASIPAPPSGTGKPTSWPSITNSHPNRALPALSGETSLCIALPVSSTRASSLPNSSWPSRRTDSRPSRVRSRAPATPERRSSRTRSAPAGTA